MRMNRKRPRHLLSFMRDRASVAALELAIVAPLMLILLAGVYDLSEAAIIRAEIYDAADAIVASASNEAVQSDDSTALTYDQVQQVESSIWGLVPSLRTGQKTVAVASITLTSVQFFPDTTKPCTYATACSYLADVVWSESYVGTGAAGSGSTFDYADPITQQKAAGCASYYTTQAQDQVPPTTQLSGYQNVTKFRTLGVVTDNAIVNPGGHAWDEAGVSPMLAIALQYTYTPLFGSFLTGPYTFWVDAYWPVRNVKTMSATMGSQNGVVFSEVPLDFQFTTLIGTPSNLTPSGTDVNPNAYCVDPKISPPAVTSPVS
jgi:Flp pilus assembly protein TadG